MRTDRIGLVTRAVREYGDVVEYRIGPRRLLLTANPGAFRRVLIDNDRNYEKGLGLSHIRPLLGDGLLTSAHETWTERQRTLHEAFRRLPPDAVAGAAVDAACATADEWAGHADEAIDLGRDMLRLTLSAFGRGALGLDLRPRADDLIDDFTAVQDWAMARSVAMVPVPPLVPTGANRRARRAIRRLRAFARDVLRDAAAAPRCGGLLAAIAALGDGERPQDACDELLTMLLAGHETTAAALAWTWFCLSRDPGAEARLVQEIDRAIGDRRPEIADLGRLRFTRAVIEESLRLFPPVWLVPRKALAADEIGGHPIRRGTDVLLSVYSLHRHPALWPRPDAFDPDRFHLQPAGGRSGGVYLPFGAGARACLGSRLAMTELPLVLAVLARRFRVVVPWGRAVRPVPSLTLQFPHAGARVERRHLSKRGEAPGAARS